MAKRHEWRAMRSRLDGYRCSQLGVVLIVGFVAGTFACQDVAVSPVAVVSVDVQPSSVTIVVGETQPLTVVLTDDSGNELKDRSLVWSAENGEVAEVDDAGVVSAMGVGTTRITATAEGRTGEATITVERKPVASVAIDPEELTLPEDGEETIHAIVRAEDETELTDREVSWSTDDEDIVEVDAVGPNNPNDREARVRALRCPRGRIRCTAQVVASAESAADTITVTVTKIASGIAITVDGDSPYDMQAGAKMQLAAKVEAADGTDLTEHVTVIWTSSVPGTAEVSPTEGATTVVAANEPTCTDEPVCVARITAVVDGVSDQVDVHVTKSVTTVRVVPESDTASLFFPYERTFTATPFAEDGTRLPDRSITWASTRPGSWDSACGEGSGLARVTLSPTTGESTTVTVGGQLFGSLVWIWAEAEGVVGCASLQIGP